jgi:hypothetical protein
VSVVFGCSDLYKLLCSSGPHPEWEKKSVSLLTRGGATYEFNKSGDLNHDGLTLTRNQFKLGDLWKPNRTVIYIAGGCNEIEWMTSLFHPSLHT